MKEILLKVYTKYPAVQIQDAIKLLYQSEFGGGHMISDEGKSLERLLCESQKNTRLPYEKRQDFIDYKKFVRYYPVFQAIDRALDEGKNAQILVAVDGMCGAGKSTLGNLLKEVYDCNLFHMDDFFLRPEQRTLERFAEPGGNVDYERFQEEILDHLGDVDGLTYQVFDCGKWTLGERITVPYKQLNIVEGSYSQHPYFGDSYDLRFFCGIEPEEQLKRIERRNGPLMLERFLNEWIPMEERYFKAFGIREKSIEIQ